MDREQRTELLRILDRIIELADEAHRLRREIRALEVDELMREFGG